MHARIRHVSLSNERLHHEHSYHQLALGMRGGADCEVAGLGGRVDASHGLLVPAGAAHAFEGVGENDLLVVDLPEGALAPELEGLFDRPRFFEADSSLRLLCVYARREAATWDQLPCAADGIATGLLAGVHRRLFGAPAVPARSRGRLDLAALEAHIHGNLHEPLDVTRLARVAHVSPGHFHALFREAAGMTPGRYLLLARLERARNLLQETRAPVGDIAHQVGFASQSALTHAFRRHYGCPPGQMRRVH